VLGVVFSAQVLVLFGLLPPWVLAGFLAYAGLRHGLLVLDLRGSELAVAVLGATAGIATGNLAITTVIVLAWTWGPALVRRRVTREALQPRQGRHLALSEDDR
jgi:hypothetical protein